MLALALSPGIGLESTRAETSVAPGINRAYENPDFGLWVHRFEREGREVFDKRHEILRALALRPGMVVADVGAGTGLFTRLMAPAVLPGGRVIAVDIAPEFVANTVRSAEAAGLGNVTGQLGTARETGLAPGSVDLVFTSDTYHHFEYPRSMLASIHGALRPGGTFIVIDFERIEGVSSPWILGHVRAGKETVIAEVEAAGCRLQEEHRGLLRANYFLRFTRD
jgi:predicted methyltransferase